MKTVFFTTCCFFLLLGISSAQTTTPDPNPKMQKGGSTIRGNAIYDDTEKPARRLIVMLNGGVIAGRMISTDGKGDFLFKNVPAGTYRIIAGFPGRIIGFPMSEGNNGKGVEVITDGTSSQEVKIRALRGSSITGRVSYPDGEPVIGAQVNVYRRDGDRWNFSAIASGGTETDDRGIFRLYPLSRGQYAISAIEQGLVTQETDGDIVIQTTGNNSINPYFYQNGSDLKTATIIEVEPGREVSNINLTLTERATYEVSGTVMANNKPLQGVSLTLNADDAGLGGPSLMRAHGPYVSSDSEGRWSFKGIPDGVYKIELRSLGPQSDQTNKFLSLQQPVTVVGGDVTGIALNLTEGAKISGTITVEGGKSRPPYYGFNVESASNRSVLPRATQTYSDGSFSISGIAEGEIFLWLSVAKGYFVKSLTYKGRDLRRQTLSVQAGQELTGVTAILSTDVGSLEGRVVSTQTTKPLPSTPIVLLPVDEMLWIGRQSMVTALTDSDGNFKITGAPGDYRIVVTTNQIGRPDSLEDLKDLARKAQRVSLKTTPQAPVEISVP